jgi:thiamine pyrophosphokinase
MFAGVSPTWNIGDVDSLTDTVLKEILERLNSAA